MKRPVEDLPEKLYSPIVEGIEYGKTDILMAT